MSKDAINGYLRRVVLQQAGAAASPVELLKNFPSASNVALTERDTYML